MRGYEQDLDSVCYNLGMFNNGLQFVRYLVHQYKSFTKHQLPVCSILCWLPTFHSVTTCLKTVATINRDGTCLTQKKNKSFANKTRFTIYVCTGRQSLHKGSALILAIEGKVWEWKKLVCVSQHNLTETPRVSHLWLQRVRRTVKLHAMGETLIGACALHIRVCFSRSATACKIKTIPSASETASKQIHNTTTAAHEQVSVSSRPVLDLFFPYQRGLFHGYRFCSSLVW